MLKLARWSTTHRKYVVIGWVALWDPAQRVAGDIVPHYFLRKRYAEIAEVELRFAWYDAPGNAPVAVDLA